MHVNSHTKAHVGETDEQAYIRQGNAWADVLAGRARDAHAVPKDVIGTIRIIFAAIVTYIRWLGYAASCQEGACADYMRRDKTAMRRKPVRRCTQTAAREKPKRPVLTRRFGRKRRHH